MVILLRVRNVTYSYFSMAHDLWTTLYQFYSPTGITGQYGGFSHTIKYMIHDHGHNIEHMPNQINYLVNIFNEMSTPVLFYQITSKP
jgi:hypothetical protein